MLLPLDQQLPMLAHLISLQTYLMLRNANVFTLLPALKNSQERGNRTDTADTTQQHKTDGEPARSTADIEGDLLAENWCKVDVSNTLVNRTSSASQRGRTKEGDSVVHSKQYRQYRPNKYSLSPKYTVYFCLLLLLFYSFRIGRS